MGPCRTYFDLNDDNNNRIGFSTVYSPQSRVPEAGEAAFLAVDETDPIDRHTLNLDIHYRWYPLGARPQAKSLAARRNSL